ncbi:MULTISPECIES: NAD(P)-dependent oxidoreductase [Priestia]|uniref:NAD(P)-dependent oxidoreductase n=1 Tax=Priestia TaxID=2800373 RepID=UPI0020423E05|nr:MULTISPECIES: NAD(P)H-binding protein [Priestia]MCM3773639.1 NAD(P)H-binding protein [Priestia aryabhattai]MDY0943010.1 NAD(P)H-binding protein [Priestia megaterium]
MKILLLGSTGRVGQSLLKMMLKDENEVTVLVRDRNKLKVSHPNLHILQGDVLHQENINFALKHQDIVVSALNTDGAETISKSMPLIINSMKHYGVHRILTIGTAGTLQSRTEPEKYRFQSNESKRKTTRAAEDHLKGYLRLKESDLNWTVICPTYLPDGEITGTYRVEKDILPADAVKISTGDTAHFTYHEIWAQKFSKCRVGIAY